MHERSACQDAGRSRWGFTYGEDIVVRNRTTWSWREVWSSSGELASSSSSGLRRPRSNKNCLDGDFGEGLGLLGWGTSRSFDALLASTIEVKEERER